MASIFKPSGRKKWYIAFRDPATGRRVTVPGYVDRDATRALATDMERIAARRAAGLEAKAPPRESRTPADYEKRCLEAGHTVEWAALCRQRIERWEAQGVAAMDRLATDTKRRYKQLIIAWCKFAGKPLPDLPAFSNRESTFQRRALTDAELSRLLATSPPGRAAVYCVAAYTGLRRGELAKLRWRDVHEDRITIYGKAGRIESVPMHPRVVAAMPPRGDAADLVFASIPWHGTVKQDYAAAGIVGDGRQVDFHSLRYTFCTMLAKAGVNIWDAMKLMRHRDVRLTTRLYLDATQLDTAKAIAKIP